MNYKALIIAVDQYKNAIALPNTVNDALAIKRLLLEKPSLFEEHDVQLFQNSISKKELLDTALKSFFENAIETDILFLFWAGHGMFANNEGYFVPADGTLDFPEKSMIKMSEVRDLIDNTLAQTVISFFDTCHSGAITRTIHQELHRGLEVKGTGKVLIAACTESQYAADRAGHGAFTDYLIQGLEGGATDQNGEIDVYTLFSYVSKKLSQEVRDQSPVIQSTLNGNPILLKRIINRSESTEVKTQENEIEQIATSGMNFWLGSIIAEYDEFHNKSKGEYEIKITNSDYKIEQALRELRNQNRVHFAIKNEADIVSVQNIDVRSTREGTQIVINLKSNGQKGNSFFSEGSINIGMNKIFTADDIAKLRIRRMFFGEETSSFDYGNSTLLESMINNPSNTEIPIVVNLISKLINSGITPQEIRVVLVGQLILGCMIDRIETLSLTVESGIITRIHFVGYRPKLYSNVDPVKIEINEAISN